MNEPSKLDSLPAVLTVPETAALLRVAKSSVYQAIREHNLPAVHIGRRIVVPKTALMRLLDQEAGEVIRSM